MQSMIIASTNHPNLRFSCKEASNTLKIVYQNERKKLPVIAVVFTYNSFIRKINREFLKHDYITDVITFPLGNDGGAEAEIYVNLDAAKNQAKKYRILYTYEVRRLLIHGVLHLLGYNDRTVDEKRRMSEREETCLELIKRKRK